MSKEMPDNPEGEDYIDWESFRKTPEYEKYVARALAAKLLYILVPDYDEITEKIRKGSASVDEVKRLEGAEGDLHDLKIVEEIRGFCEDRRIKFDIQENIKQAEKKYPEFVRAIHNPILRRMIYESMADELEKHDMPDLADEVRKMMDKKDKIS